MDQLPTSWLMTFTGLMRRLFYAFWENRDLDIDTRRENQFGFSEPWQTRVQHVLERNKRYIIQNFIPLSLISHHFSCSSVMICRRIGLSKKCTIYLSLQNFPSCKNFFILFQKLSKWTYGLTHMGIILYNLVFVIM